MGKSKKDDYKVQTFNDPRPYVLWARVSTESQGESGLGLAAQRTIAEMFMGKEPVQVFTDVYSGTKLKQCKALWDAIELCKEKDYVLVIAKSDRFRNVQEALEVLDAVGQNRLIFCDLPSSDRFVLTVMFAMWERQAIIGRVNTKIALAERKKQIERDGGFESKAGNWCTRLGSKIGVPHPEAINAMAIRNTEKAREWRRDSPLYTWLTIQVLKNRDKKDILAEAAEMYKKNPEKYCTRKGRPLQLATFLLWRSNILKGHDI